MLIDHKIEFRELTKQYWMVESFLLFFSCSIHLLFMLQLVSDKNNVCKLTRKSVDALKHTIMCLIVGHLTRLVYNEAIILFQQCLKGLPQQLQVHPTSISFSNGFIRSVQYQRMIFAAPETLRVLQNTNSLTHNPHSHTICL